MRYSVIGPRNPNISACVAGASRKPWKRTGVCTCDVGPSMPCGVSSDSNCWPRHGVAWVELFFHYLFMGFPCHSIIPGVFGITSISVAMVVTVRILLRVNRRIEGFQGCRGTGIRIWMMDSHLPHSQYVRGPVTYHTVLSLEIPPHST